MITTPLDNPRSDDRTGPNILRQSIDVNAARFSLQIPDNLFYFEDHFPGYPMLPGVVQIKWVTDLAGRLPLPDSFLENFSAMTKLKFMRRITPGNRLTLELVASPLDRSLNFRFFDDKGDYSSGQLSFK